MPTILRIGSYRFFFYASDRDEPAHIHVEHGAMVAKFWIDPVRLQNSGGFSRSQLNVVRRMLEENLTKLLESWNEYFND